MEPLAWFLSLSVLQSLVKRRYVIFLFLPQDPQQTFACRILHLHSHQPVFVMYAFFFCNCQASFWVQLLPTISDPVYQLAHLRLALIRALSPGPHVREATPPLRTSSWRQVLPVPWLKAVSPTQLEPLRLHFRHHPSCSKTTFYSITRQNGS